MAKLAEQAERYEEMVRGQAHGPCPARQRSCPANCPPTLDISLFPRRARRLRCPYAAVLAQVEYMKKVASASVEDLSLEERNLLSVAYKNVVGARRASLRIIGSIEAKEKSKDSEKVPLIGTYKSKVESELNAICEVWLTPRHPRTLSTPT